MKHFFYIAWKSLASRKFTSFLTVLTIAMSVFLLLGLERVRAGAKQSFESTVSGVDLIVGGRSSSVNLMLFSVFRIGNPTHGVSYSVYQALKKDQRVSHAIPLSLGDSFRGFPVIGTEGEYFDHFRVSGGHALEFSAGRRFQRGTEVVIGSEVAKQAGLKINDEIVLSHGVAEVSFHKHDDHPFSVVGILRPTGTPVDQSLHVSLESISAIHDLEKSGSRPIDTKQYEDGHDHANDSDGHEHHDQHGHDEKKHGHDRDDDHDHEHDHADEKDHDDHHGHDDHVDKAHHSDHSGDGSHDHDHEHDKDHDHEHGEGGDVSAIFVGLKSKAALLELQDEWNRHEKEPVMAILPSLSLRELWKSLVWIERLSFLLSSMVLVVSLIGLLSVLLTGMNERVREVAIFRSLGAGKGFVSAVLLAEGLFLSLSGILLGYVLLNLGLVIAEPLLRAQLGLSMGLFVPTGREMLFLSALIVGALVAGGIPAWSAYRQSLHSRLSRG